MAEEGTSLPPTGAAGSAGAAGAESMVSGKVDLSDLVKQVKQLRDNLDLMESSSNRAQVNLQRMASTSLSELVVQTAQIAANLDRIGRAPTAALDALGVRGTSMAASSGKGAAIAAESASAAGSSPLVIPPAPGDTSELARPSRSPSLSSFTPDQRASYNAYQAAILGGHLPEGMTSREAQYALMRRVQVGGEGFASAPSEEGSAFSRLRGFLRGGGAADLGEDVTIYGSMGFLNPATIGPLIMPALAKAGAGAKMAGGALGSSFKAVTNNSNRHSLLGAFGYGLTVVPGFMAAQGIMSTAGSILSAGASAQGAAYDSAWTQGLDQADPIVGAEMRDMGNLAGLTGFAPSDLMTSFTENYRLAGRQRGPAIDLTRAGAITSRLTGNDPATTQDELAPIYKAFGKGAVLKLPDILAQAKKEFDVSPQELELAMARSAPIANMVGMGTNGKDLEYLAAMEATMMQDADINPATTQSAMRMFAADLRAPGKARTLKRMGFGDISHMQVSEAMQELADIDQGKKSVGGKTGHDEAVSVLETLSGPRTGMYAGDLLSAIDKFSQAVDKFSTVTPGTGAAYVEGQMTKTLSGAMDRMNASWQSMWSDPNFGPTQAATGAANFLADLFGGARTLSGQRTEQDILSGNKLLHGADTFDLNPLTLSGPGNNAMLLTDPGRGLQYVEAANASMLSKAKALITDPKTSAADRASLLKLYNQAKKLEGDTATYITTTTPASPAPAVQAASTNAGYSSFAREIGRQTGIPAAVVESWMQLEHGGPMGSSVEPYTNNNPLNLMRSSADPKGTTTFASNSDGNVASYPTAQAGIDRTVSNIMDSGYYDKIVKLAQNGASPQQIIAAIGASPWDTGHYKEGAAGQAAGYNLQQTYNRVTAQASAQTKGWWSSPVVSDRDPHSSTLPVHSSTDAHGKGIFASHPLTHDTDFQMKAGTPVHLGFSGTFLGEQGIGPNHTHGWGNEMDFALDGGGYAKAIHLRSMQDLVPGQHYDPSTLIGTSGGVPGLDVDNTLGDYSNGEHLCWVTDDKGYKKLLDLRTGKIVATQGPPTGPVVRENEQAHMSQIMSGGNQTPHSDQAALHVMRASEKYKVNPYAALAFLRAEGSYDMTPQKIDEMLQVFGKNTGGLAGYDKDSAFKLLQKEIQNWDWEMLGNDNSKGQRNKVLSHEINDQMKALQNWGALSSQQQITLTTQQGTAASTNASGTPLTPYEQQSLTTLQQIMLNTQAATDAMTRMASINLPSDYTLPTYNAWAAHNGAARSNTGLVPAKGASAAVHAGTSAHGAGGARATVNGR